MREPSTVDIAQCDRHVRLVPIAEIATHSLAADLSKNTVRVPTGVAPSRGRWFDRQDRQPQAGYSITSSARPRSAGGSVRPRAAAVLRFTIKSNLVGCSTGISAGFFPRSILST